MSSGHMRAPRRPVLWVSLLFAAGVWVGASVARPESTHETLKVTAILASLCLLATLGRARWLLMGVAIISCGILRVAFPEWVRSPRDVRFLTATRGELLVYGVMDAEPDVRPSGCRLVIKVDSLTRGHTTVPVDGRVIARFKHDPGLAFLDRVILAGRLAPLPSKRNPGEFDYGAYLLRRGIGAEFVPARWRPVRLIARSAGVSWTGSVVAPLRGWIRRQVYGHLDGEPAALVLGLLFGEKEAMSDATVTAFEETGTLHLLAVSGSNVAVVVAVVWGLLTFIRVPRLLRIAVSLFGVVLFCHLAHNEVSVVRASVAAVLVLTGIAAGRITDAFGVWGGALLIQLSWDPWQLFEVGFQLSFLATLGILLLNPLARRWPPGRTWRGRAARVLVLALSVSVAAQIATLPVLAHAFNRVPLITPLSNLLCVPLAGIATAAGAVTLLLAPLGEPILSVLCATTWLSVQALLAAVVFFDRLALPVWQPASPSWICVIAYASALGSTYTFVVAARWRRRAFFAACAMSTLLIWWGSRAHGSIAGIVLDTGSDPATLLKLPDGRVWLVSTSPSKPLGRKARVLETWLRHSGWAQPQDTLYLGPAVADAPGISASRSASLPGTGDGAALATGTPVRGSDQAHLTVFRNSHEGGWFALRLAWSVGEVWWVADSSIPCDLPVGTRVPAAIVTPGDGLSGLGCLDGSGRILQVIQWSAGELDPDGQCVQVLNVRRVGAVRLRAGGAPPFAETAIR